MIIRRESKTGSNDLNVVYRPCTIGEMLGNETNKKLIRNALDNNKVHHTQLFTGAAGCGKTTVAKIIALGLNCEEGVSSKPCLQCESCVSILDGSNIDVKEINVGQSGGKDYVDVIVRDLPMAPFNSKVKVIIFDEAHKLTDAAKDLLLKPTETGFDHVYFIFCTNQPDKLRGKNKKQGNPFLDRCSILNFDRISNELIFDLLKNVCEFEGFQYIKEILDVIVEEAKGVPRLALMWLNQVATEGSWKKDIAREICGGGAEEDDPQIFKLSQALNKAEFKNAVTLFGKLNVPVETVRIVVSRYFVSCLKRSKTVRDMTKFSEILDVLLVPIYEHGKQAEYKWYNYMAKVVDIVLSNRRA